MTIAFQRRHPGLGDGYSLQRPSSWAGWRL